MRGWRKITTDLKYTAVVRLILVLRQVMLEAVVVGVVDLSSEERERDGKQEKQENSRGGVLPLPRLKSLGIISGSA